jgi:membrane-bound lytic murein transglycosylase D
MNIIPFLIVASLCAPLYSSDDGTIYLKDPKNRVNKEFVIEDGLYERTKFWFNIYTVHDSRTAVYHDSENLSIIYHSLNTRDVADDNLKRDIKQLLVKDYRKKYYNFYKDALKQLQRGSCSTSYCKKVLFTYRSAKIKIPTNKKLRIKFFKNKIQQLRVQTGQRDKILKGLKNISYYQETLERIFDAHKLPHELLGIPLLESSFNTKAKSKVNATGPWQFMKFIGKHFMIIDSYRDQRRNPFISTSAALHLLKQNKSILKRWDLAINAYNSGTGNLLKGTRALKKRGFKNPGVVELINNYKNPSFQFASKNFYAEFLALAHIIPYKNLIYPEFKKKTVNKKINIYLTKCKVNLKTALKSIKRTSYKHNEINNHLSRRRSFFPKGTVVFSDVILTKRRFHKIKYQQFKKYYPKKLAKIVRRYKCSSK